MARYLFLVEYTVEAAKAARSEGYAQREAMNRGLFDSVGGELESWWWTAGDDWDLGAMGSLPAGALASIKSLIHGAGTFARSSIVEIFDSATMDQAAGSAMAYRPPSQSD
jgi:uncharacterized protein with GYD domain